MQQFVETQSKTAHRDASSSARSQEEQIQTVTSELKQLKANLANVVELTEILQANARPKRAFRNVRRRQNKSQQRPDGMVFSTNEDLKKQQSKRDKMLHNPYEPSYPKHLRNVTLLQPVTQTTKLSKSSKKELKPKNRRIVIKNDFRHSQERPLENEKLETDPTIEDANMTKIKLKEIPTMNPFQQSYDALVNKRPAATGEKARISFNEWLRNTNVESSSEDIDDQQGEQKRPETQLKETKTRFKPMNTASRNMHSSTA